MVSSSMFTPEQLAKMHSSDSRVHEILWAYSVPIVASIVSTVLRLYSKRLGRNGIALDDYFIITATMCLTGECAVGLILGRLHHTDFPTTADIPRPFKRHG
jgi:hypothetical protein